LSSAKSSWPPPGNWILRIGIPNCDFSLSSQTKFGTSSRAKIAEKLQFKFFRKFKTSYCSSCPIKAAEMIDRSNHQIILNLSKKLCLSSEESISLEDFLLDIIVKSNIFFRNNFSLITYSFKNHFQIYVGITWA